MGDIIEFPKEWDSKDMLEDAIFQGLDEVVIVGRKGDEHHIWFTGRCEDALWRLERGKQWLMS